MKTLTVIELSKLYGMNRQSIYKRINKGDLSKNSDGRIDLAEAIRVFGEPSQRVTEIQSSATQKSAEVDILKLQVDFLNKQLEEAKERELFQRTQLDKKDEQIDSLQRLLGAPKQHEEGQSEQQSTEKPIDKDTDKKTKLNNIESIIEETTKPKQRGLFNRFIRAVFDS